MRRKRIVCALPLVIFAVCIGGCGTGSVSADVRSVNEFLAAQDQARHAPSISARSARANPFPSGDEAADVESERKAVGSVLAKPMDAEAAVRLSLILNHDLRASMLELGVSRGKTVQAGLLPNPTFELALRQQQDPSQNLQAEIGIEYDITDLVLLPLRKGVAVAELGAERVRVAGEVLDTGYRARIAFYEVQARQAILDLRARSLSAFQAGFAAAEELHRVGNMADMDWASHRAAVEASRIDVAEAENTLLDARERLNVAIGLSGEQTSYSIAGPLLPPTAVEPGDASTEERAVKSSFELNEIAARMDVAAKRVGYSRSEGAMPKINGGFHGEHDGISWELGGHVTIGLPVFDRGQGRVISAESDLGALRERYIATATALRSSVRMAQNRVESAGKRAVHYRDFLIPARERALAETVLQYNAMQLSVFQLLDAQRRVTDTGVAYVETLLEYWKARAALDQILAGRHRVVGFAAVSRSASPGMGSGEASGGH